MKKYTKQKILVEYFIFNRIQRNIYIYIKGKIPKDY
jgi:hypothetical protein